MDAPGFHQWPESQTRTAGRERARNALAGSLCVLVLPEDESLRAFVDAALDSCAQHLRAFTAPGIQAYSAAVGLRPDVICLNTARCDAHLLRELKSSLISCSGIPIIAIAPAANVESEADTWIARGASAVVREGDRPALRHAVQTQIEFQRLETEANLLRKALSHRLGFEALFSTLSSQFIHSSAHELEDVIDHALEMVGEFTEVDRCFAFQVAEDQRTAYFSHEWCAPGIEGHRELYPVADVALFPWSIQMQTQRQYIYIPDVDAMPDEAAAERDFYRATGTRSMIAVPVIVDRRLLGVFGLATERRKQTWLEEDIRMLEAVGQMIGNALERKRKEEALHRSEVRFREFADRMPVPIGIHDGRNFVFMNDAAVKATGYLREHILGKEFLNLIHPDDRQPIRIRMEEFAQGAQGDRREVRYITRQGEERWADAQSCPIEFEGEQAFLVVAIDITDRKRLERQVLDISAREQIRIGQDLHDRLGQHLTGIGFKSQTLAQALAEKDDPEAGVAATIVHLVTEAIVMTRNMARGLYPIELEAEGLMTALEEMAVSTQQLFGVSCRFVCEEPIMLDRPTAATHLYRIAQEAVNNAVKHGKPASVEIALAVEGDLLVLSVTDDGVGIVAGADPGEGLGMSIMSYRANMLGGTLNVEPGPSGGTRVCCTIALPQRADIDGGQRGETA
ncbi:MAG: PAS domain S-box protein [Candidatus Hydrogenedentes bacterium]|nr:PAS domain S-box protein [Candidatus Hydrogenedentota bacterium]